MGANERNAAREERMRAICAYVRELSPMAPVTEEAVARFALRYAGAEAIHQVKDNLVYLTSVGDLKRERVWGDGVWMYQFAITAQGIDRLDGRIAPWGAA